MSIHGRPLRRLAGTVSPLAATVILAGFLSTAGSTALAATPPPNDNIADAQVITEASGSTCGTTLGATQEANESNGGTLHPSSVWFRWTAPSTGAIRFSTAGSDVHTELRAWGNTSFSSSHMIAINHPGMEDSSAQGPASVMTLGVTSGKSYWISVGSQDFAQGAFALQWAFTPAPANDNFANAIPVTGSAATVTSDVLGATREHLEPLSGGPTVWFRWTAPSTAQAVVHTLGSDQATTLEVFTGPDIAHLSRVVQPTIQPGIYWQSRVSWAATAGTTYWLAAARSWLDVTLPGQVRLTWNTPVAPPGNDSIRSPRELSGSSGTFSASNVGATVEAGEPEPSASRGGASVWFAWTAPVSGSVSFDTLGSPPLSPDDFIGVYTGTPGALTYVQPNEEGLYPNNSRVTFPASAGTRYLLAVDGSSGSAGPFSLSWSMGPAPHDSFSTAYVLAGAVGQIELSDSRSGSLHRATDEPGEPVHAENPGGRSIWFRWVAPVTGAVTFDYVANTTVAVSAYTGDRIDNLRHVTSAMSEDLTFHATAGVSYSLAVEGWHGVAGQIRTIYWNGDPEPPVGHVRVAGGATSSATPHLTLEVAATDASSRVAFVLVSNSDAVADGRLVKVAHFRYEPTVPWSLWHRNYGGTERDGEHTVWVQWVDEGLRASSIERVTVNLSTSGSAVCRSTGSGSTPTTTTSPTTTTTTTTTTPTTTTSGTGTPRVTESVPEPSPPDAVAETSRPPASGYWMVAEDGGVYAFGDSEWFGNAAVGAIAAVDVEPTPSGHGYWVVDRAGHVFAFGDGEYHGGAPSLKAGETVTSLSTTRDGNGYWLFTTAGRVLPYGEASFHGDMSATPLTAPVLDSVPTPSGNGYYMVAGDGGIFTFGDAQFHGSMGATKLNAPVQSLVPDPDGAGYWLVASDGGIFSFESVFHGSMGGTRLNRPVTGMVGRRHGYLMVAEDGGIFAFGDAAFRGSLGSSPPPSRISSVAAL